MENEINGISHIIAAFWTLELVTAFKAELCFQIFEDPWCKFMMEILLWFKLLMILFEFSKFQYDLSFFEGFLKFSFNFEFSLLRLIY